MIRFFMVKAICTTSLIGQFWIKNLNVGGKIEVLCWLIIIESDWSFLQVSISVSYHCGVPYIAYPGTFGPLIDLTKPRLALATLVCQPAKCTEERNNLAAHSTCKQTLFG